MNLSKLRKRKDSLTKSGSYFQRKMAKENHVLADVRWWEGERQNSFVLLWSLFSWIIFFCSALQYLLLLLIHI